jgi:hypothetical protein
MLACRATSFQVLAFCIQMLVYRLLKFDWQ